MQVYFYGEAEAETAQYGRVKPAAGQSSMFGDDEDWKAKPVEPKTWEQFKAEPAAESEKPAEKAPETKPEPEKQPEHPPAKTKETGEHWVTIQGTHVKIDGDGAILAGPKALADKGIKTLHDLTKEPEPETTQEKKDGETSVESESPGRSLPESSDEQLRGDRETGERERRPDGPGNGRIHGAGDPGPDGQAEVRPSVITARQEYSHAPSGPARLSASLQQSLSDDQKHGAEAAIRQMDDGKGYLLADGTGVGKTRQILAVAGYYAAQGKKVLIVAPSEVIKPNWKKREFFGSYRDDSKTMGLDVSLLQKAEDRVTAGNISLTTYNSLEAMKSQVDGNTVVLFDEAHALKNHDSARSKHGEAMIDEANSVLFATATPADKPTHLGYLARAGVFAGMYKKDLFPMLGMRLKSFYNPHTGQEQKTWEADPQVGWSGIYERMGVLFDAMTNRNQMVKRELGWDGVKVQSERIELGAEAHEQMAKIDEQITGNASAQQAGLARARSLLTQRFAAEQHKIPAAVASARKALDSGRQVVLFVAGINASNAKDEVLRGMLSDTGTSENLKAALAEHGITDIAEIHGNSETGSKKAMEQFQAGTHRVCIATIESGGTGINLDDRTGDKPRTTIFLTPPLSGSSYVQAAGRTWRKTTRSKPELVNIYSDSEVDGWNEKLVNGKLKMLNAVVQGETSNFFGDISEEGAEELATSGQMRARHEKNDAAILSLKRRLGLVPSEQSRSEAVPDQEKTSAAASAPAKPTSATFTKLRTGDWGLRVTGTAKPGDKVTVTKKDGTRSVKTIGKVMWTGDGVSLCSMYSLADLCIDQFNAAFARYSATSEYDAQWWAEYREIAQYASLFKEEDHPRDEHHQKFAKKTEGAVSNGPQKPSKKPAGNQDQLFATSDQGMLFGKQAPKVGDVEGREPEKKEPSPDEIDKRPLTHAVLFERAGHQFEILQTLLGIKKPRMGSEGAEQTMKALGRMPGGSVIAALLSVDGRPTSYNDFGFANRGQDAFRAVIDKKFSQPELDAAKDWLGNVDPYLPGSGELTRFMRGTVATVDPAPHTESPLDAHTVKQAEPLPGQKVMGVFEKAIRDQEAKEHATKVETFAYEESPEYKNASARLRTISPRFRALEKKALDEWAELPEGSESEGPAMREMEKMIAEHVINDGGEVPAPILKGLGIKPKPNQKALYQLTDAFDDAFARYARWDETLHPRGQPENKGEFAVSPDRGGNKKAPQKAAAKPKREPRPETITPTELRRRGVTVQPTTRTDAGAPTSALADATSDSKKKLKSANIKSAAPIGKGNVNVTIAVELEDGTRAIFKPDNGQNCEGLRSGISGKWAEREAAASAIADIIGLSDLVPETVIRMGPGADPGGRRGSFQKYVEQADVANDVDGQKKFDGLEDEARAGAFDYLIGNSDRHGGNWMLADKQTKLALIDNGLSFPDSNTPGMFNARMLRHLEMIDAKVPPEVREWQKQSQSIANKLREFGFNEAELKAAMDRLNSLSAHAGLPFSELKRRGCIGWDYWATAAENDRPPAKPADPNASTATRPPQHKKYENMAAIAAAGHRAQLQGSKA